MLLRTCFLVLLLALALPGQRNLSGTPEIKLALDRLNTLGSVLMIAAHPDDENTALIAYFARGRNLRTAYLALTRGEGGQNLIGSEQSDKLGIIRTEELLAARKLDSRRPPPKRWPSGAATTCFATWCSTSGASGPM
jgi:hypothetical protein